MMNGRVNGMTQSDKRRHSRKIRRIELTFLSEGARCLGFSSNFSQSGIFIRTNHPAPQDAVIEIQLYLPDGGLSRISGRVMRSALYLGRKVVGARIPKNGMGVEIIEKDAAYERFVASLPD